MGKGARLRGGRTAQAQNIRRVFGANAGEVRKALHREINQHLGEAHERFFRTEVAVILWCLHDIAGFGRKRLRRFYDRYTDAYTELRNHYMMSEDDLPFLAEMELRKIGVDLKQWEKEDKQ